MFRKFYAFLIICIAITSLTGCGSNEDTTSLQAREKLRVSVTFNAMKEFAIAVGKEKVEISTIIPDGSSIHHFEPKARDLTKLSNADVFIYNGLGIELWAEDAIKAANNDHLIVVDASEGADVFENTHDHDDAHEHSHGKHDPHLWLGLKGAQIQTENIKNSFIKADPENKDFYEGNYNEFIAEIESLYNEFKEKFEAVGKRNFVTGHAAFGYLCRDFGLEQNSIMDIYAEGEPSAQQLAMLVEYCRQNNVTVIFSEETASPQVSKTLADEVGARVESIYTIETSENGKTYLERMRENLTKIYESM